ncbi:conjugal transfer protein TraD [Komagataeibacter swingsii]|uniref:Conjugal transfer protein TraD n=1 Tax=Komagataeibacter swingsii TaxID=215220 RepID=A0A2V4RJC2_9PROT|nr:conjugal transfer protein TraD [Komagataeibacter swingsii]PYD68775.1 conjugal transfer protein TraD [Komagataeibacter swingsii]GBQ66035.1 conjugal transfer protein TraD [Komagataeibacter swingsii DSM 16373]
MQAGQIGNRILRDIRWLTDDDRATLFEAFLDIAGRLQGGDDTASVDLTARWRHAGLHAFDRHRKQDRTGQHRQT